MSKEGVVLSLASLTTDFKGQNGVLFHGHVPESHFIDELSDLDKEALQNAAQQARDWMAGYDLAGIGGGTKLMDAGFALFGDLLRAYLEAEYP